MEKWVAGLTGDYKRGVDWWAEHRSAANPGLCRVREATNLEFVSGCEAARARLAPVDIKRKSDPEYRRGWNTYNDAPTPQPFAAGPPVPPVTQVDGTDRNDAPGRETPDAANHPQQGEFDISDNPNTNASAAALARRLFAATIQPSDWEDAKKLYRIARLLVPSQENGRYMTPYGSWIGADEFEIAHTRRRFAEEFAPRVKREAARFPLHVVDTEALRLDEWDSAKHRFKLLPAGGAGERERLINLTLQPALSLGELVTTYLRLVLDRDMPLWLPANADEAEAIVSGLLLDSSQRRDRRVYLHRELEIVGPRSNPSDPNFIEFTAKIVRMDVFADANLTKRLLSDAAIREADPSAAIGNAPITVPDQVWLDEETVFLLRARAGVVQQVEWITEMEKRRAREQEPANAGNGRPLQWGRFFPSDYRHNGSSNIFPPNHVAAFQEWTKRRGAEITTLLARVAVPLPPAPQDDIVELPLWKKSQKIMSGEDLLGVWSSDTKTWEFHLSHTAPTYVAQVPLQIYRVLANPRASSPSAKAIIRFDLQEVTASAGHVVIELEPRSIRLGPANTADNEIPDREYPIAAVGIDRSGSPQVEAAGKPARINRPVAFDVALLDLLAARAAGEQSSKEALAYLVIRRWVYEGRPGSPIGGRFFRGGRQPTPEEAAELGKSFIAWAKTAAPAFPIRAVLSAPIEINKGRPVIWSTLQCFWPPSGREPLLQVKLRSDDCQRRRQSSSLSPPEERQCAAVDALMDLASMLVPINCGRSGMLNGMPFRDSLEFRGRFSGGLPAPEVKLGVQRRLNAEIALTITGATFSRQEPRAVDMLPADLVGPLEALVPVISKGNEFVTFDIDLAEARYLEGDREAGRFGSEQTATASSVLKRLKEETATPIEPSKTSDLYKPDMIGVRLGMSFEEAEKAIRDHMKVGRVLDGIRNIDPNETAPLTSGKLFISEDNLELVAIYDEPPAVSRTVFGAWRQIYVPNAMFSREAYVEAAKDKYKKLSVKANMQNSNGLVWLSPEVARFKPNCFSGMTGNAGQIGNKWRENGQKPVFWPARLSQNASAGSLPVGPTWGPNLIDLFDTRGNILDERRKPEDCGAKVTLDIYDQGMGNFPYARVDVTLFDDAAYVAAYGKSRRQTMQTMAKPKF
jgi:hypothetical protein